MSNTKAKRDSGTIPGLSHDPETLPKRKKDAALRPKVLMLAQQDSKLKLVERKFLVNQRKNFVSSNATFVQHNDQIPQKKNIRQKSRNSAIDAKTNSQCKKDSAPPKVKLFFPKKLFVCAKNVSQNGTPRKKKVGEASRNALPDARNTLDKGMGAKPRQRQVKQLPRTPVEGAKNNPVNSTGPSPRHKKVVYQKPSLQYSKQKLVFPPAKTKPQPSKPRILPHDSQTLNKRGASASEKLQLPPEPKRTFAGPSPEEIKHLVQTIGRVDGKGMSPLQKQLLLKQFLKASLQEEQNEAPKDTDLTPTQKHLIRSSWREVRKRLVQDGADVFTEYFNVYPEYLYLFSDGQSRDSTKGNKAMQVHAATAMYTFSNMIELGLSNPKLLDGQLTEKAQAHYKRQVGSRHFKDFANVMITYLRKVLGPNMTPEMEAAWGRFFDNITTANNSDQAAQSF